MLSKLLKASTSILIIIVIFFLPQNTYASIETPLTDGFDYPLGAPNSIGYSLDSGLSYLERWDYTNDGISEFHPGEDWNDDNSSRDYGNDNNDASDPVYAISDGLVKFSSFAEVDWGYLMLIEHKLLDGSTFWSQYAHLSSIESKFLNKKNILVKRGEKIGEVGDYWHGSKKNYHLHFEIRKKYRPATAFVMNWPKSKVEEYYVNPSEFINSHRPKPPVAAQKLTAEITTGGVVLSWDENTSKEFTKFEIYRSEVTGGTKNLATRTLIETITDQSIKEYVDNSKLLVENNYYYSIATFEKDGRSAYSNEVTIIRKREYLNLTQNNTIQKHPKIGDEKIIWEDMGYENNRFPYKRALHYYDITTDNLEEIKIGSDWEKIEGPYSPEIINDWFCYLGKNSHHGSPRIYCHNIESGIDIPLTETSLGDSAPVVSETGYVVWGSKNQLYFTNINGTAEVNPVHESENSQFDYDIWNNLVIWKEKEGSNYKLVVKNLETSDIVYEKDDSHDSGLVAISGSWLTWCEGEKIKAYNYETREGIIISENGNGGSPAIYEDRIVYETISGGSIYLNVFNLGTRTNTVIDFPLFFNAMPCIYKDILVFQAPTDPLSNISNSMDIWLTWL